MLEKTNGGAQETNGGTKKGTFGEFEQKGMGWYIKEKQKERLDRTNRRREEESRKKPQKNQKITRKKKT